MKARLDHEAVIAALQEGLGSYWTVTVRSAKPQAPLIAMYSGVLKRAEPKDETPPGETEFVWYVGTEDKTWGAFSIPRDDFRGAGWEPTPRGEALVVQIAGLLVALFKRAVEEGLEVEDD